MPVLQSIRCPVCRKKLPLNSSNYLSTAAHLRKCGMYHVNQDRPRDNGWKVCLCGERFVTLLSYCHHLKDVPHDWKKMRVLQELREM